jgi:predicted DNA-binding protein
MAGNYAIIYGRRYAIMKQPTRNLHVPLPDPTYRRLRLEAQRTNRPATELVREAIDRWLAEQQRILVHESVAEYALAVAGSPADFDEQLEAAGIESLVTALPSASEDHHG